jgi:CHAD domain-containing protein
VTGEHRGAAVDLGGRRLDPGGPQIVRLEIVCGGKRESMAKSRTPAVAGTAAAAVALAGAAAAGGKLAHDRRSKRAADGPDRTFRLRADEYVPDGIRRVAGGQLSGAQDDLESASKQTLGDAVHETRKRLKRLRATLRLSRNALGDETYDRENTVFRMAGRRLSGARDAQVLVETLDALRERFADELPRAATDMLRAQLQDDHERATDALREDEAAIDTTLGELGRARTRAAGWTLDAEGFAALQPGLRRIYRRGRKRIREAAHEPTTESFHEARKRVKDLWHATQIVRPAAPKKLKRLSKRAHHLADLLGDDHDLAVLRDYVERNPQAFADESSRGALLAVLDRRREALQRKALKLGAQLYDQSPKRFVRGIERGWHKRAAKRPEPLAG